MGRSYKSQQMILNLLETTINSLFSGLNSPSFKNISHLIDPGSVHFITSVWFKIKGSTYLNMQIINLCARKYLYGNNQLKTLKK